MVLRGRWRLGRRGGAQAVDEPGLAVLDKVYEGGITPGPAGSQPGDGKPKLPVTIETAVID